jgi:hypothetical protein
VLRTDRIGHPGHRWQRGLFAVVDSADTAEAAIRVLDSAGTDIAGSSGHAEDVADAAVAAVARALSFEKVDCADMSADLVDLMTVFRSLNDLVSLRF